VNLFHFPSRWLILPYENGRMRKKIDLLMVWNEIVLARKIEDWNLLFALKLIHLDVLDVGVSYCFQF